jgi:hypothetical protein
MSAVIAFVHARTALSQRRNICAALVVLSLALVGPSELQAQASPYCIKVQARARSEAVLLFAPRLHAQLLRNPSMADLGPLIVDNFQLRVGASFSPVEALRGARLVDLSEADCQLQTVQESGRRLVASPIEALFVAAYRAQVQAFHASSGEREKLMATARERLRQKLITVLEFHEIEQLADELQQKQEVTRGALARLEAEGVELPSGGLDALARSYTDNANTYEKKARSLRALDPWTVRLAGGAIPTNQDSVDWYGWLEVGYSLGGLFRAKHENRYQEARRAEIDAARYELPAKVRLLARQVNARLAQAESELSLNNKSLKFIDDTLRSLGTSDLPNISHARDSLLLQRMIAVAEQAYLHTLVDTLAPYRSNQDGTSLEKPSPRSGNHPTPAERRGDLAGSRPGRMAGARPRSLRRRSARCSARVVARGRASGFCRAAAGCARRGGPAQLPHQGVFSPRPVGSARSDGQAGAHRLLRVHRQLRSAAHFVPRQ